MSEAINTAIIRHRRILLVKKEDVWIFPGGKPKSCDGNSSIDCLHREIKEELPRIKLCNILYYKDFKDTTPHAGDELEAKVYFANFVGNEKVTNNEISESKWFGINEILKYKISDISRKIIDSLREEGYLYNGKN